MLPIAPNDYWWYVTIGHDILQNYSIPVTDSFTYTELGKPYIYNSWLSSVVFWLLRDPTYAILLRGALAITFCGLIWRCCRVVGAGIRLTAILVLLVVLIGASGWAMRPQLFSLPLFGLALLSILHWQRGNTNWAWLLPAITLAWVNLHGAFPILFLLAGAALVGGQGNRKVLAITLILSLVASLCNPLGIDVWHYVFEMLTHAATQRLGPEWLPPSMAQNWRVKLFFLWLLVFPIITAQSACKLTLIHWLWFLGFGLMALSGLRYVMWFGAVFAPINAILLAPLANKTIDKRVTLGASTLNGVIFTAFIFAPLAFLPETRKVWMLNPPPTYSKNTPIAAVEWLKLHPDLPGNLWADLAMSAYLINALPERPVWIDTRTNLFSMEHWNNYLYITRGVYNWETLLERDEIKLLLLDPSEQSLLINALKESSYWSSPYQDEHSIIFTKNPRKVHT